MEQQIRDIRINLDGLTRVTKELEKSREVALSITSLELSKCWLGKVLQEMDIANPYPESRTPENKIIEPTADTYTKNLAELNAPYENWESYDLIQKIKVLRQSLKGKEEELKNIEPSNLPTKLAQEFLFQSYLECIKAQMWLGMSLGAIRDKVTSVPENLNKTPLTPDQAFKTSEQK